MLKTIMSKRFKAISATEISQNPLVMSVFGAIIAVAVVGTIAYLNNENKANDAQIYATTLNGYLSQQYDKAQALSNDFYIASTLDKGNKYVKINGQNIKQFYKYPIATTFVTATGSELQAGDEVNMTWGTVNNGQVAIGLFTTSNDLTATSCNINGTKYVTDWTYSHVMAAKDWTKTNAQWAPDICKGYDDTISQIIVAGKPATIKSIENNVFKTASNVDEITVDNGGTTLSWLVITLK